MTYICLPGETGALSIYEAVQIATSQAAADALPDEKRHCISVTQEDGIPVIELEKDGVYQLDNTVAIPGPLMLRGNGATIINNQMTGFLLMGSHITLEDVNIQGGLVSVSIDSMGEKIEDIRLNRCRLEGYMLAGVLAGGSKSASECRGLSVTDCCFKAGATKKENGDDNVMALDLILTAACSTDVDVNRAVLDDVTIERCEVYGPSICNFMIVPGLSLNPQKTPMFDGCSISNMRILNCKLRGSDDTAIAAQANYINNPNCFLENFDVIGCDVEFGLTGLSSSGGSPMTGSVSGIYQKNVRYLDNILTGKPDVGETRTAVGLSGGGINYGNTTCLNSWIENVEVRGNRIFNCERGITVHGGYSMIDADAVAELSGNYAKDIYINNNTMTDVENCFIFYGLWIEGRRFDWNWGKHHTTQTWLPHPEDNSLITMAAKNNYVENLTCTDNHCKGFSYLLRAAGAVGRGHGYVEGNRMTEGIVFENNTYEGGENHIIVADTILEDWVADGGRNAVDKFIKENI